MNTNRNDQTFETGERFETNGPRVEPQAAWYFQTVGTWVGGLLLIGFGVLFLLQNFIHIHMPDNWWALFIMIPAVGSFGNALASYQKSGGRFSAEVRGSMMGGLILTLISAIFLFGLSWAIFWPTIIILAGIGMILNSAIK